jgi:hypothetical protein
MTPTGKAFATNFFEGAKCKGRPLETFFPAKKVKPDTYQKFCKQCPIQQRCLNYALCFDSYGIWGGLTRRQRNRLPLSIKQDAVIIGQKEGWYEILKTTEEETPVEEEPRTTPKQSVFSFSRS